MDLTALEFRLLSVFIRRRGRLLTRRQLIDAAWGTDTSITDRVVDTHVLNLRKKVEPEPGRASSRASAAWGTASTGERPCFLIFWAEAAPASLATGRQGLACP